MHFSVTQRLKRVVSGIPAEEIVRQDRLLSEGGGTRATLTALVYAIAALMVPLPVVLACAAADFTAEWIGQKALRGLVPAHDPWRYGLTLGALMVSQGAFTLALAFVYQSSQPLALPFAAGVLTLTMLQMASIRAIHLPYAAAGLGITFAIAVGGVLWDWSSRSGPGGLALSLLSLVAAAYFIYIVVKANHALHSGYARERAAALIADQAKSRFLAQMSHELRTPLNAILGLGHAEMVEARDPGSVERMRLVTEAARGLAVILDDILDMAAIEAGHLPIRPGPCDLAAEIKAAAALYLPLYQAQGLALRLALSPDLPRRAVLDAQRLRQCLSNLFSNALKHTKAGGVTLTAQPGSEGQIEIVVADTGSGIAADLAERIFEPFQRGSGDHPGSGLGLSITRALARSMAGDLVLLPSDNGARFRLTLRHGPEIPGPEALAAPATVRKQTSAARVLIVDDIATNRLVARTHLRLLGLETDEASSGAEAIDKIRNAPPDMVFLDMNMPGLDGLATLKLIRTLPSRTARVPVIAMTADATESHRRQYLEAGLDGYLAKPLTPEAVADIVARFAP